MFFIEKLFKKKSLPYKPKPNVASSIAEKENCYSIIPLNLFQMWNTLDLPPKMKDNVELIKNQNPEFKYRLYNEEMCRDFIEENFDKDVLYAFDKLEPIEYKSDLWRYCILYKYGGIYLDIKFNTVNGFKLKYLTNKEYFIKDSTYGNITGVYQGLLVALPNNKILYNCIQKIVENVKNNLYNHNSLCITGSHLLSKFFNSFEILNMNLHFTGNTINIKNKPLLKINNNVRIEQIMNQKFEHHNKIWEKKEIYNYPTLNAKTKIDLSKTIDVNILGKNIEVYSGTPTIIDISNNYLINRRWINYNYNENGSKKTIPKQWVSINSRYMVDENFNQITDETFLQENYLEEQNNIAIGLEDIRIFYFNDEYYYIGTYFDINRNLPSVSSGIYNINNDSYELNKNIISPKMYDTNKIRICEKNWSFINYKNELCVVYNWFPLQIGKIDYEKYEMNIVEIKYNIPEFFKEARGSTCGIINNNEIWFILHKAQFYDIRQNRFFNRYHNYQHFFAAFDLDMNLIRYSELFKFEDNKIEYCVGMIFKNDEIILAYSAMDTNSIIATYDIDYINNNLKWHLNI
jgi:mannosyltransferase OCH1-like enzyme